MFAMACRIIVVFFILADSLLLCGCMKHAQLNISDISKEVCDFKPKRRECFAADTAFPEGAWREIRPFRVFLPVDAEIEGCCLDFEFGRIDIAVPNTRLCAATVVMRACNDDISSMLEYYQSFSSDGRSGRSVKARKKNSQGVVWYMEKKYADRRILMELRGAFSNEMKLSCWCELDSGISLRAILSGCAIADSACEWLWRLLRGIKIEIKCRDAFNCLRTKAPFISNIPTTRKLQWNDANPDIGTYEWTSFRSFRVFLPSKLKVECCGVGDEHFVFDLPDKSHYVTAYSIDLEDGEIDRKLEFYSYSMADLNDGIPSEEKEKIHIALVFREMAGIDWYMEKKCADRRLLIEHRHQREGLEGLLCCCEFYEGPCVIFKIRGNGAIDSEDLEFFMKICQEFKYEKVMEAQDSF